MVMPTEIYHETELLRASMQGDTVAFEAIVKKYQSFICAITFSATADFGKSEELAQETFISAWKDLAQLKDLSKFKGWLISISRNIIRNSFRRQKRDLLQKSVSLEKVQEDGVKYGEPSEAIITKEQQAVVQQALNQIPERYREPLVLFYREQQSVKQVAAELDLSEEAAKQRLSRGRKMLKEQVAAIVETTISRTGPSVVFTAAVIAALPAIAPQVVSAAIGATAAKGSLMAKSSPFISTIGWILGPLLGFIGAIVAIRVDLKNTSIRERKFIFWANLLPTVYSLVSVSIMIPFGIWMMYHLNRSTWVEIGIALILMILMLTPIIPFTIWAARRQKQIQIEDGTYIKPEWRWLKMTKFQVYAAFGGSIFGSLGWLFRLTVVTDDWGVFGIVLAVGFAIFLIAAKTCSKSPQYGFRIASVVFICVGLLHLLLMNLRWNKWAPAIKDPKVFTLAFINWSTIALVAVLVLVALITDWRHQTMRKRNYSF
jgi:RNA polymerase sigma factor (sigma-70 family)